MPVTCAPTSLTAPPRSRETREQARRRGLVDIALVGILSDAGLRRSECAALTWSDIEAAPDGSGRVTIARSKTDQTAEGRVVAITAATMAALAAIRPELPAAAPVFGLSADRIARRVKAAARAAGLGDAYSGHSGRVGMARRMVAAGAPVAAVIRQGRWSERRGGAMVARYTRREDAARPPASGSRRRPYLAREWAEVRDAGTDQHPHVADDGVQPHTWQRPERPCLRRRERGRDAPRRARCRPDLRPAGRHHRAARERRRAGRRPRVGVQRHSGRVGCARRMTAAGAPTAAVQQQGRWKSPAMVSRYTRSLTAADAARYR